MTNSLSILSVIQFATYFIKGYGKPGESCAENTKKIPAGK